MECEYRVLIVDDDPAFSRATQVVLESHGYCVDSAHDGDEGLVRMGQQRPDLVLLDVMMSWPLDGVHVSRAMMARRELRDIPIIMVTSIRNSEYRGVFPQDEYLHINSWLDKPCSPDALLAEVQATLAQHKRFHLAS
jgi:DNA-binding response OmpR family regulator